MKTQKLALLFPGQGSQTVGMGKDFYENFKEAKLVFEEASDAIHVNLKKLCFDGPEDELTKTENLQPALFTVEMAIFAALKVHVDFLVTVAAGHSLGEYSAFSAAGSLSFVDGVRLTCLRGGAMQEAVPLGAGTMAAVLGLGVAAVEKLCQKVRAHFPAETVEVANFNAPGQTVIAGTTTSVEQVGKLIKEDAEFKSGRFISLQVSAPFHCSLMKPAQEVMAKELTQITFKDLNFPVICNVTAEPVESSYVIAGMLADQITQPVRWEQSMYKLKEYAIDAAIEVGPGKVLTGLLKRTPTVSMPAAGIPAVSISTVRQMKEFFS